MSSNSMQGYYGKNFWGKKWAFFSAVIVVFTGVMIFYFDNGDRLIDTKKIQLNRMEGERMTASQEKYLVEFWLSKMNDRKYKLKKNELIIFGFKPSENLLFFKNGEKYFLVEKNDTFELKETKDFLPIITK